MSICKKCKGKGKIDIIDKLHKFEDLKDSIDAYKHTAKTVDSLLVAMSDIITKCADELDPDGELIKELEKYCHYSIYHRTIQSEDIPF
tara:strand:- start:87 stop:350 length:264 start_codon:yes stop_codon:yes gene_type:complete